MTTASYPLVAAEDVEPYGICCMDCERPLTSGMPYSERFDSLTIDGTPLVEVVCVYCAAGARMTCTCVAVLRAEAQRLLVAADAAARRGDKRNAAWARAKAFGCARAVGILRRAARQ